MDDGSIDKNSAKIFHLERGGGRSWKKNKKRKLWISAVANSQEEVAMGRVQYDFFTKVSILTSITFRILFQFSAWFFKLYCWRKPGCYGLSTNGGRGGRMSKKSVSGSWKTIKTLFSHVTYFFNFLLIFLPKTKIIYMAD